MNLSSSIKKRKQDVTCSDVISCFHKTLDVAHALDSLDDMLIWTKKCDKISLLLQPELLSRLSICLYWMMHLRCIIPFSSFLNGVSATDITSMVQELLINLKTSSVYDEVFGGIIMHIFNDACPVTNSFSDLHVIKCQHIIHQICFHSAFSGQQCSIAEDGLDPGWSVPLVSLRSGDLSRLRHVSDILSASHNSAQVEVWRVMLLRSLLFCHVILDNDDTHISEGGSSSCISAADNLLGPLNNLLETFSPAVASKALTLSLQVQPDERDFSQSQLFHLPPDLPSNPASTLLLSLESYSPLDAPRPASSPAGLCAPVLHLLLAAPASLALASPFFPRELVLSCATSVALLGIHEQQNIYLLRGLKLVALASSSVAVTVRLGSQGLVSEWLHSLILGQQITSAPPSSSMTDLCTDESTAVKASRGPLSLKEFQFLCFTLCSTVACQSECVLRELCSVLRAPAIRALDPDHEAVDMFLQLSRTRLRDLQDLELLEGGKARGTAKQSPLLQILARSAVGKGSGADCSGGGEDRNTAAIPEVTAARIQSWAVTFKCTGELPVSVSQLCIVLAQGGGGGRGLQHKGNNSTRSQSYRVLFDCMEHMIREELLAVTTSSAAAAGKSGSSAPLSLTEACKVVAVGMSKCSPPLCSLVDASAFADLITQIASGTAPGASASGGVGRGVGATRGKEAVLASVNHVLPAASKTSPPQWQDRVNSCRRAVEKALLIPTSIQHLVMAVDVEQYVQQQKEFESSADSAGSLKPFSFTGFIRHANESLSVLSEGAGNAALIHDEWLSVEILAVMYERWLAACRDAALSCSMLHGDVLRRFIGNVTLLVLRSCHFIFHKIIELHEVVESLYKNESKSTLAPSFAAIVVRCFKLASILSSVYSEQSITFLDVAFSLIRHGWRRKEELLSSGTDTLVSSDHLTEYHLSEEGANALFLMSLAQDARDALLHVMMMHMSQSRNAQAEVACMTVSIRLIARLKATKDQCDEAVAAAATTESGQNTSNLLSGVAKFANCTEASTLCELPQVAVMYVLLVNAFAPATSRQLHGRVATEIIAIMNGNSSASASVEYDSVECSIKKVVDVLCRPESHRLFAWVHSNELSSFRSPVCLSRRERRDLLARMWLFLCGQDHSTTSKLMSLEDKRELGPCLTDLVLAVIKSVTAAPASAEESSDTSYQLSGTDLDLIETVVEVVGEMLLPLLCPGRSLLSLCSRWLDRVWAVVVEGETSSGTTSASPLSVAGIMRSPPNASAVPQASTVGISFVEQVEVACALQVLQQARTWRESTGGSLHQLPSGGRKFSSPGCKTARDASNHELLLPRDVYVAGFRNVLQRRL